MVEAFRFLGPERLPRPELRSGRDQSLAYGEAHELGRLVDVELLHQARAVALDGAR